MLSVSMVDWVSSSVGLGEELLLDLVGEERRAGGCLVRGRRPSPD